MLLYLVPVSACFWYTLSLQVRRGSHLCLANALEDKGDDGVCTIACLCMCVSVCVFAHVCMHVWCVCAYMMVYALRCMPLMYCTLLCVCNIEVHYLSVLLFTMYCEVCG